MGSVYFTNVPGVRGERKGISDPFRSDLSRSGKESKMTREEGFERSLGEGDLLVGEQSHQ